MAEALARRRFGDRIRVQSAGSQPAGVNPMAVRVLEEVGIDMAEQRSKSIDTIDLSTVDTVVTLCREEVCPVVPGLRSLHWPLADPAAAGPDEALDAFRRARDEIARRLDALDT
jgi:arsenate reductase